MGKRKKKNEKYTFAEFFEAVDEAFNNQPMWLLKGKYGFGSYAKCVLACQIKSYLETKKIPYLLRRSEAYGYNTALSEVKEKGHYEVLIPSSLWEQLEQENKELQRANATLMDRICDLDDKIKELERRLK